MCARRGDPKPGERRRASLLEALEASPGIHLRELSRKTGLAEGVLRHHLRHLYEDGQVRATKDRNRTRYYLAKAKVPNATLIPDLRKRVVEEIARFPAISHRELGGRLGLPRTTLDYHVAALVAKGAIVVSKAGRRRCYDLAEPVPSRSPSLGVRRLPGAAPRIEIEVVAHEKQSIAPRPAPPAQADVPHRPRASTEGAMAVATRPF